MSEAARATFDELRAAVVRQGYASTEQSNAMLAALDALREALRQELEGRGFSPEEADAGIAFALVGIDPEEVRSGRRAEGE